MPELHLLLELNQPDALSNPWNRTAHIVDMLEDRNEHHMDVFSEQEENDELAKSLVYLVLGDLIPLSELVENGELPSFESYVHLFKQLLEVSDRYSGP